MAESSKLQHRYAVVIDGAVHERAEIWQVIQKVEEALRIGVESAVLFDLNKPCYSQLVVQCEPTAALEKLRSIVCSQCGACISDWRPDGRSQAVGDDKQ